VPKSQSKLMIAVGASKDTHLGTLMSKFERMLVAGSTELPDCRCSAEMQLVAIVPVPGGEVPPVAKPVCPLRPIAKPIQARAPRKSALPIRF
jgi:hypothetical protein